MQTRIVSTLVICGPLLGATAMAGAETLKVEQRLTESAHPHRSVVLRSVAALPGPGRRLVAAISTGDRAYKRDGFEFWVADMQAGTITRHPFPADLAAEGGISTTSRPLLVPRSATEVAVVFQTDEGMTLASWTLDDAFELLEHYGHGNAVLDAVSNGSDGSAVLTSKQLLFFNSSLDLTADWSPSEASPLNLISMSDSRTSDGVFVLGQNATQMQLWDIDPTNARLIGSSRWPDEGGHLMRVLELEDRVCTVGPGTTQTSMECWSAARHTDAPVDTVKIPGAGIRNAAQLNSDSVLLAPARMANGPVSAYRLHNGRLVSRGELESITTGPDGFVFNAELVELGAAGAVCAYTLATFNEQSRREALSIHFVGLALADD